MIFVDTSFFFALLSENDPDHKRVCEVFDTIETPELSKLLLTSNHVVFETIRLTRRKIGHPEAVSMGELLYSEKMAQIHWATKEEEKAAFGYLTKYHDQDYSMVDCLSFAIMERKGIREALTVDSDFTHHFIARPGPLKR
ncbi:MAG: type II toxin-antitoxin system toxin 23S rRNA-specific endonuclease VapC20 [Acidobacteriota bacterium]|nr:MAG: type II toxin-antitoxin system toxin 23S rRNA-specific endonuclease VapC20 [Acidobacteriota bacterium]